MVYIEVSREKIFPLAVITSLVITAAGAFFLFDAFTRIMDRTGSFFARERSDTTYWLMYQAFGNEVIAATPTSTTTALSVPVLLYHGESERAGNTPFHVFVDQMRALKRDGWHTITLAEFRDFMRNGKSLPDKSFLLTFDDGRRDTFYPSDPVLKDLGFNAVMYVITGSSMPQQGRPQAFYLNRTELEYMINTGRWELQSHGDQDHLHYRVQSTTDLTQEAQTVDGHFMSNKLWKDSANRFESDVEFEARIRGDLEFARGLLENTFGVPIYTYAFPFSDYGGGSVNFPGAKEIVARVVPSMYTFAMYQHFPGNGDSFNYPDPSRFMIRRIEPHSDWSGDDLIAKLNQGRAKQLPYVASTFGADWLVSWGNGVLGDTLQLNATRNTGGASAFLNGSGWWRDYFFEATVNKKGGESVSLLARNQDDIRYIGCTYSNNLLIIEKQTETGQIDLAHIPTWYTAGPAKLGISVQGSTASCYLNGVLLGTATFTDMQSGGIGLEVWDRTNGVASSEFTGISVKAL